MDYPWWGGRGEGIRILVRERGSALRRDARARDVNSASASSIIVARRPPTRRVGRGGGERGDVAPVNNAFSRICNPNLAIVTPTRRFMQGRHSRVTPIGVTSLKV